MTNKHDMTDGEYEIYQKIHHYDHPLQEEESKIEREISNAAHFRRKHHTQLKQRLNQIAHPGDIEDWDDDAVVNDYEIIAEREIRNAKTHKQRLKRLARRREHDFAD